MHTTTEYPPRPLFTEADLDAIKVARSQHHATLDALQREGRTAAAQRDAAVASPPMLSLVTNLMPWHPDAAPPPEFEDDADVTADEKLRLHNLYMQSLTPEERASWRVGYAQGYENGERDGDRTGSHRSMVTAITWGAIIALLVFGFGWIDSLMSTVHASIAAALPMSLLERRREHLLRAARHLAAAARSAGLVLTISQEAEPPLAMGRHRDVIDVRTARTCTPCSARDEVHGLLRLVGHLADVPRQELDRWTEDQCAEAAEWAVLEQLAAGAPGVRKVPMPQHVAAWRQPWHFPRGEVSSHHRTDWSAA